MFGKKIHLFSLFGFDVGIDISWMLLAILIMWSLATGLFPYYFKGLPTTVYWWMGMIGATGLFLSIVFHETEPLPGGTPFWPADEGNHTVHLRRRGGNGG